MFDLPVLILLGSIISPAPQEGPIRIEPSILRVTGPVVGFDELTTAT